MQTSYYVKSKTKHIIGLSLLTLILLQLLIPSPAYLATNKTILNTHSINSIVKPLQQSSSIGLLGPNNENQPVVNEGNNIKLKVTDVNGNPVNDSSITFTSDSPDVASVDNQGNIQGKLFGFATVTAKRGSESAQIFVVVARVQQAVGMMLTGQMEKDNSGGLYLSDPTKNIVIKKSGAFAAPTIFAGTGMAGSIDGDSLKQAQFRGPVGIAVDNSSLGGVYIADSLNHKIRKVDGKKQVTTVLGNGSPSITPSLLTNDTISFTQPEEISLNFPQGVAVNVSGQVFVADSDNSAIYLLDFPTPNKPGKVTLFAGQPTKKGFIDGKGRQAMFNRPIALNLNSTTKILNVLDQDSTNKNTLVRQIAPDGTVKTIKKNNSFLRDGTIKAQASDDLVFINGKAIGSDNTGNIYVVDDTGVNLITFPLNQDPQIVSLAQPGQGITFNQATSITVQGTQSFVVDSGAGNDAQAVKVVSVGAPIINALNTDKAKLEGGIELTISGRNFAPESLVVLGDQVVTDAKIVSATEIRLQVPAQNAPGKRTLSIQTRGGIAQREFTIVAKSLDELAEGEITTIAGGIPFIGDSGLATKANLRLPQGVTVDGTGNIFIADTVNHRIRRIDNAGVITTIAGNGTPGFSGDGGLALSASLNSPRGIVFDNSGNLLIADFFNLRIRKVDVVTGIITTIAGNGQGGFSGDGGLASSASLGGGPYSITVDTLGNLFIADAFNHRIRKVDVTTKIIATVVGSGLTGFGSGGFSGDNGLATNALLDSPFGVAVDKTGNLFIADSFNNRIRKVDTKTNIITTVVGNGKESFSGDDGLATSASLFFPNTVTVDPDGNLFIADFGNNRVRKVDGTTGIITTVVGNGNGGFGGDGGLATSANLAFPANVSIDGIGNLLIAEQGNNRIRRADANTKIITTVAGGNEFLGNGGLAVSGSLANPKGIAINSNKTLFISDRENQRIAQVDTSGNITSLAGSGQGGFSGDGGLASMATVAFPGGIALDPNGNLVFVDRDNNRIRLIDSSGKINTIAGNGNLDFDGDGGLAVKAALALPDDVAIDGTGNIFIADTFSNRIRKIDAQTKIITTIAGDGSAKFSGDGGLAKKATLNLPQGLAVDKSGNLFISDTGNQRVRRIDARTGTITTVAGNGVLGFGGDGGLATNAAFSDPLGLVVDGQGNIFVADEDNNRIRRIDGSSGIITTIAGNGMLGFSGDNSLATKASLAFPKGLAMDNAGNLFIAGGFNNAIRVVKGVVAVQGSLAITDVLFKKPNLTISGNGFGLSGAVVKVNGQDISSLISNQTNTSIVLQGNKKKFSLKKGQNQVTVMVNGLSSTFSFTF